MNSNEYGDEGDLAGAEQGGAPKSVPYSRFKEANEKRKATELRLKDLERENRELQQRLSPESEDEDDEDSVESIVAPVVEKRFGEKLRKLDTLDVVEQRLGKIEAKAKQEEEKKKESDVASQVEATRKDLAQEFGAEFEGLEKKVSNFYGGLAQVERDLIVNRYAGKPKELFKFLAKMMKAEDADVVAKAEGDIPKLLNGKVSKSIGGGEKKLAAMTKDEIWNMPKEDFKARWGARK